MNVGIDKGGGDQRSVELNHRINTVSVSGCRLLGADPGDLVVGNNQRRRLGVSRAVDMAAPIQRGGP